MNQKLVLSFAGLLGLVASSAFAQSPAACCDKPDCCPHVEAKAVVSRLVEKKEPTCECTTIKLWKPEIKEVTGCKWVDVEICREVDDGCCAPGCCNHAKRLVIQVIPVKKEYRYKVLTFKSEEIDVPKAASVFECGPPETVTTKIPVPCADGGPPATLPK